MSLPRNLLTPDEQLLLDLRPHWIRIVPDTAVAVAALFVWAFAQAWLSGALGTVVGWVTGIAILAAFVKFAVTLTKWLFTHFAVTNERIIVRSGVIAKHGIEIPLDRINTVFFEQSILDRLVGAGDLIIESASEQGRQRFEDVKHPNEVQQAVYRAREGFDDEMRRRQGAEIARSMAGEMPGAGFPQPRTLDVVAELERLGRLREQGLVTPEEFEQLKARLLGS